MDDKEIMEFIRDENNRDFLEETYLYSNKIYGWNTLSSGKIVYIGYPAVSGEEVGNSLKKMSDRIQEMNI